MVIWDSETIFHAVQFLETMDRTTAERIIKKACEDYGVTYRQDTPEDSIYQDGPRISFINQSGPSEGKPEKNQDGASSSVSNKPEE